MKEDLSRMIRSAGILTMIPTLMIVGPLIGFFVGRWIETRTGIGWAIPVSIMVGLAAGFRETYRIIRRVGKEKF
jgi:uncharacterized protein YqgC (DUF456 family)